jgi:undecaprenyl-phosphate 4-deoxy-4-formamido-L-arabinose transferase
VTTAFEIILVNDGSRDRSEQVISDLVARFSFVQGINLMRNYIWQGNPVPGFPFLASVIAILSGAQLFTLGIIGEYLARMHFRMMERPTYTVREHLTNKPE